MHKHNYPLTSPCATTGCLGTAQLMPASEWTIMQHPSWGRLEVPLWRCALCHAECVHNDVVRDIANKTGAKFPGFEGN